MAYDFSHLRNPVLKRVFEAIFNTASGHDHDGTNSKLVSAGAPAAGALSADATGRAMMAADLFDAATVLAKFAADSIDNAQLLKAVKDGACHSNPSGASYDWEKVFYTADEPFGKLQEKAADLYEIIRDQEFDAKVSPSVRSFIADYLK